MAVKNQHPRGAKTPSRELQKRVSDLVREKGERAAMEALGISKSSIARLAAGLPCLALTIAQATRQLGIDEVAPAAAAGGTR
jgi:hypothetical protein